ncbi:MAG: HAD-IIIA family hydrolase [Alphaproteobacteria bacterium]|jgi:D-glycero-D-manno-heptose 1,7-bisphosphate phosphatase|nr:HAD-IIIA family hydrolase [Alphaproteobacteria bacterium]
MTPNSLVLLDRDGVINVDRKDYVKKPEEFIFEPGSIEAIKLLNQAHIPVIIITNQGGIGRGLYSEKDLENIHGYMKNELKKAEAHVDHIIMCPDHPDQPSHRRKPNPGMIEEALALTKANPERAHMIGDDLRDIIPAFKCGIHRHLVLTGKGEQTLQKIELENYNPIKIHKNLLDAVRNILSHE